MKAFFGMPAAALLVVMMLFAALPETGLAAEGKVTLAEMVKIKKAADKAGKNQTFTAEDMNKKGKPAEPGSSLPTAANVAATMESGSTLDLQNNEVKLNALNPNEVCLYCGLPYGEHTKTCDRPQPPPVSTCTVGEMKSLPVGNIYYKDNAVCQDFDDYECRREGWFSSVTTWVKVKANNPTCNPYTSPSSAEGLPWINPFK